MIDTFLLILLKVAEHIQKVKKKIKYKKEENIFKVLKEINDTYITNKVSVDINVNPLNLI